MEIKVRPHSQLLALLFASRQKIFPVFTDVLGIYGIKHIAITHITNQNEILCFSSTPALEFELFQRDLWRFDDTYDPAWFKTCTASPWQALYQPAYYEELYHLKQSKYHHHLGYSLATQVEDKFWIYSFAKQHSEDSLRGSWCNQIADLYTIGRYCTKRLSPLFYDY